MKNVHQKIVVINSYSTKRALDMNFWITDEVRKTDSGYPKLISMQQGICQLIKYQTLYQSIANFICYLLEFLAILREHFPW